MTQPRRVTLTFDNGPDPEVTPVVLDELARRGVRSTFFVVGNQLCSPEAMAAARRAADEGHWIGNHTLTHRVPLGELDDAHEVVREIEETQALLSTVAHPDRLFRPFGGGGEIDSRLLGEPALRHLRDGAYTCVVWNCVPRDWENPTGWVETALEQVSAQLWSVVVVHDLPTGAMDRLPDLLDGLDALGVQVVQDFPDDCVLLRRGVPTPALGHLLPSLSAIGGIR